MQKCIAFDFDGTIADTRAIFTDIYNNCLVEKYGGRKVSGEEIETMRKMSLLEKMRYLKISTLKIPLFVKAARSEMAKRLTEFPLFEGIDELLLRLKDKGYTLAVLSTNRKKNIRRYLELKSITVVDHVYSDFGASLFVKSRTIRRFLKKNETDRDHFIYVGDELRDIEACKKVGVPIVAVTWGWDSLEALQKGAPDLIVNHPPEIEQAVATLFNE